MISIFNELIEVDDWNGEERGIMELETVDTSKGDFRGGTKKVKTKESRWNGINNLINIIIILLISKKSMTTVSSKKL